MRKKGLIIIIVLLLLVGGWYILFRTSGTQRTSTVRPQVKVRTVELTNIKTTVEADGTVGVQKEAELIARVSGRVISNIGKLGLQTEARTAVLRLENEDLKQQLKDAQFSLLEAEEQYEQILKTYDGQEERYALRELEAMSNLEIAQLTLEQETIKLANQREIAEKQVKEAQRVLEEANKDYKNSKKLYTKKAISSQELELCRVAFEKARERLQQAEEELNILVTKTIPTALKLAKLKVENANNQLTLLPLNYGQEKITEKDLELAYLREERAKDHYNKVQQEINHLMISTPIHGVIIDWQVEEGDLVTTNSYIGRVADLETLQVEAWVDEIYINSIQIGQKAVILSDAVDKDISGEVISIAPVAVQQGNGRRFQTIIEIESPTELLKPGMFVTAEITTKYKEEIIKVPTLVIMGEEQKYIYVYNNGKVVKRNITVGIQNLSDAEITGLEPGEKVIIGPYPILKQLRPQTEVIAVEDQ